MTSRIRSGWPSFATPGSVTSIARVTPRRLSSQPASSAAPGPNLIGVASRVKTVSCSDAAMRLSLLLRGWVRAGPPAPGGALGGVGPVRWPVACHTPHGRCWSALSDAVGPAHVLVDPEVAAALRDRLDRALRGPRAARRAPRATREVAAVLAACAEHGVAVVPQGGNTGPRRRERAARRRGRAQPHPSRRASATVDPRHARGRGGRGRHARAPAGARARPRASTPASTSARATRRPSAGPSRRTPAAPGRCATARRVHASRASRPCSPAAAVVRARSAACSRTTRATTSRRCSSAARARSA